MGTRADFYVGLDEQADWLGSIAYDGYEVPTRLACATSEEMWRRAVTALLLARDDAALPEHGWPWPWPDSHLTDCVYSFAAGGPWVGVTVYQHEQRAGEYWCPLAHLGEEISGWNVLADPGAFMRAQLVPRSGLAVLTSAKGWNR